MDSQERGYLAPPCGLYCGACGLYVAQRRGDHERVAEMARKVAERRGVEISPDEFACDGCWSPGKVAFYCRNCALRDCAKAQGVTQCAQCAEFPCGPLTAFNDDGRPHHSEVLANVRHQREIGLEAWLDEQERRWRCPSCGAPRDWYTATCAGCGAALADHF